MNRTGLVTVLSLFGLVASGAGFAAISGVYATSAGAACKPGYSPCLPVRPDLDCDQIADASKPVRVTGFDPYELDADGDGIGCDVRGTGVGAQSPWGLVLQRGGVEAPVAQVGMIVTAVGWSPTKTKGKAYWLCSVVAGRHETCKAGQKKLGGRVQTFGRWTVGRGEVVQGKAGVTFTLALFLNDGGVLTMSPLKASDNVRVELK